MEYFIDIERLVEWTYSHNDMFSKEGEYSEFAQSAAKNWRRYEKLPSKKTLETINRLLEEKERSFETINIAELIILVNNEKDQCREHKNNPHITSTGKKVFNIIVLGRMLDGYNGRGCFNVKKDENDPLYNHLSKSIAKDNMHNLYYYLPGRTFSLDQLKNVGNLFKNGIAETAFEAGVNELIRCNLVEIIDKENYLYKLCFNGCKAFIEQNRIKDKFI